jgi:hypothetical protein
MTAIIAPIAGILAAVATGIFALRNQRQISSLDLTKIKENARTSYEYDARKRLYTECEPIIFQIIELSDWALKLIEWLAEETGKGTFDPKNNYFIGNSYIMRSTLYRLLSPLAAFRILQSKLTTVDLRLDNKINLQYMLAKKLYETFTMDDKLAELEPKLEYTVTNSIDGIGKWKKQPKKFRKQGFNFGSLDKHIATHCH